MRDHSKRVDNGGEYINRLDVRDFSSHGRVVDGAAAPAGSCVVLCWVHMSMSVDVVYVRVADSGGRDARHSRSGLEQL